MQAVMTQRSLPEDCVLARTPEGSRRMRDRAAGLPARLRSVLFLVDGSQPVRRILAKGLFDEQHFLTHGRENLLLAFLALIGRHGFLSEFVDPLVTRHEGLHVFGKVCIRLVRRRFHSGDGADVEHAHFALPGGRDDPGDINRLVEPQPLRGGDREEQEDGAEQEGAAGIFALSDRSV